MATNGSGVVRRVDAAPQWPAERWGALLRFPQIPRFMARVDITKPTIAIAVAAVKP